VRKKWILLAPLAIIAFLLFIALGGWLVMLLWNWLLPPLTGWPAITFWQALGLLVLCRILFGGFGGRGGYGYRPHGRRHWRKRWARRMEHMTPEERERFRDRMRERWGFGPFGDRGKEI